MWVEIGSLRLHTVTCSHFNHRQPMTKLWQFQEFLIQISLCDCRYNARLKAINISTPYNYMKNHGIATNILMVMAKHKYNMQTDRQSSLWRIFPCMWPRFLHKPDWWHKQSIVILLNLRSIIRGSSSYNLTWRTH